MFIKGIAPKQLHDQFGIYNGLWMPEMDRCWMDYERGYQVCSRLINTKFGKVEHVTIIKIAPDGEPIMTGDGSRTVTWNEKMMIKNELFGENRFAIEVYPKQDRLIDVTDTYHLWVFDKKTDMPFGIHPKEYTKAINRGCTPLTHDELTELKTHMDNYHNEN